MPKPKTSLSKKRENAWTEHRIRPTTGRTDEGVDRLHVHAVDDSTNGYYIKAVSEFLRCVRKEVLPFRTFEKRDVALADYFCDMCSLQDPPRQR